MSRLIPLLLLTAATALAAPPALGQATSLKSPEALAALDKMGAALRTHQMVNVHADITAEDALNSGEKLQYSGTVDIVARRPNLMKLAVRMGTSERVFYYNGKTLTTTSPNLGYYASVPAPATIAETLKMAEERYGVEVPLADLFAWGTDPAQAAKLTSAFKAGEETIGGQTCDHYAMRQPGADWQLWIRQGDDALPCKLVITTRADPALPQYSAVYRWSDEPPPEAAAFTYTPPAGSTMITMGTIKPASARKGN